MYYSLPHQLVNKHKNSNKGGPIALHPSFSNQNLDNRDVSGMGFKHVSLCMYSDTFRCKPALPFEPFRRCLSMSQAKFKLGDFAEGRALMNLERYVLLCSSDRAYDKYCADGSCVSRLPCTSQDHRPATTLCQRKRLAQP